MALVRCMPLCSQCISECANTGDASILDMSRENGTPKTHTCTCTVLYNTHAWGMSGNYLAIDAMHMQTDSYTCLQQEASVARCNKDACNSAACCVSAMTLQLINAVTFMGGALVYSGGSVHVN